MKRQGDTFGQKLERLLGGTRQPSTERMESGIDQVWERLRSERQTAREETISEHVSASSLWLRRKIGFIGAAAVIAVAFTVTPFMKGLFTPDNAYALAEVETVRGSVYQLSDGKERAIGAGEKIQAGTALRTDAGAAAVLKFPDGAVIEMPAKSQLSLEQAQDGVRIRLDDGSVRVKPSKQPSVNLYVQNREVTVPVTGPVFESAIAPTAPQAPSVPRWEAVSIKPCDKDSARVPAGARGNDGVGEYFDVSPGRFTTTCMRLWVLMNLAYVSNGERLLNSDGLERTDLIKGPEWIYSSKLSDRYSIEAVAEGTPEKKTILGPMLQALLEERFHLKSHRESEEVPMYSLVVAKGGLKIKPINEAQCTPDDKSGGPKWVDQVRRGEMGFCGFVYGDNVRPGVTGWAFGGHTMSAFASILSRWVHKPIIDQTGVSGRFRIYLEVSDKVGGFLLDGVSQPANVSPAPEAPQGPDVFSAIQDQLGLKLVDGSKGPHQFIVIDHVERPTEN